MYTRIVLTFLLTINFWISQAQFAGKRDSLEKVIDTSKIKSSKINALLELSLIEGVTDTAKALMLAREALSLSEENFYKKSIANAYNFIGEIYYIHREYGKATAYFSEAFNRASSIEDNLIISESQINLAKVYFSLTRFDEALENYLEGARIKESFGEKEQLIELYETIGIIYGIKEKYLDAFKFFEKCLKISEEFNHIPGIIKALNNLGDIQSKKLNYEEALANYQRALELEKKKGNPKGMAKCYDNIGDMLKAKEKYADALVEYSNSLSVQERYDYQEDRAYTLNRIGDVYIGMGEYDRAVPNFQKGLKYAQYSTTDKDSVDAYIGMSKAYEEMGKHEKALEFFKSYQKVKENVIQQKSSDIQKYWDRYKTNLTVKIMEQKDLEAITRDLERAKREEKEKTQKIILVTSLISIIVVTFLMYNRYQVKQKANYELKVAYKKLEHKNSDVAEKNKALTDSIRYAKRIQQTILPPESVIKEKLPDSFVVYLPKDIVSGDFYWMKSIEYIAWNGGSENGSKPIQSEYVLISAVDCTGHGVPGAFMSIVGSNLLNQAVKDKKMHRPSEILDYINEGTKESLKYGPDDEGTKDGMDIALCALDFNRKKLEFSGANNPLILIRNGELIEVKGDKQPIGEHGGRSIERFTNHEINLEDGDVIYIFSDGFADQFGGPLGKKFKTVNLKKLLVEIHDKSMGEQKLLLLNNHYEWKGKLDQVDDICIIGIRV